MKILILFLFILASTMSAWSKNTDTQGALTFISLSKKVSKYGAINLYHYDISNFEKKRFGGRSFESGIVTSYLQTSYSYQYLPWLNLSLGHIFQRSNPFEEEHQDEHRIFQQLILSQEHSEGLTTTHRFRFEERFIKTDEGTDFRTRLRYQIGAKMPLRGVTLDPGELYLNTYNEFYFSTTGERNALFSDDWFYFGAGLNTAHWGSFELGPLIQWSRINEAKDTRTHYTVQLGWIFKFD